MKLGVIGTGAITRSMLAEYRNCSKFEIYAICSRREDSGRAMAEEFSIPKVYTALADMLSDPQVEIVYVATPNSIHYSQTRAALLAGKHVICEKPFCPTAAQAAELISLAKESALLLVDATPTAYLPNLRILKEQLPKIGRVRAVMGNYSQYSSRYDRLLAGEITNVFDPNFAGGCLMDINYYNLYLNIALFGKPRQAEYAPNLWKNGIDTSGCLTLRYDDFVSTNVGAKDTWGVNFFQIEGEQGYIYISGGSNGLDTIRVVTKATDETFNSQPSPDRWSYEAEEITRLLLQDDTLFFQSLLETTQCVMEVLESARRQAGICFPCDQA